MSYEETLYARFLSGELSEEEIVKLKETGEWEELESIRKATDKLTLPAFDIDKGFGELLEKRSRKTSLRFKPWQIASIAAAILLMIFASNYFLDSKIEMNASFAETLEYNLPDNSIVVLNSGSTFNYDKKAWMNNRSINLKGEAFFDVEKGSSFTVSTNLGEVEVLGTKFNIRSWGDVFAVECYSGSVAVKTRSSSDTLAKYQSVYFVNEERRPVQTINNDDPQWTLDRSYFKEEKFSEVLREIERQFDIEVRSEENNRRFSGSFQHQSLKQALEQVCFPLGYKYELEENDKIVRVFE